VNEAGASAAHKPQPAISIRNVSHRYDGSTAVGGGLLALDNVSVDVAAGEFVCLLGPSGCGKSTLLNIIGGLMKPSAGDALVEGQAVAGTPRPDKIAFVFQESTLFPWYTVRQNFRIALKFQHVPGAEWDDRTMAALQAVGMESFIDSYPDQLSVGMRQRVNLARAISVKTDILLMDEPFAALDEQTRMVLGEDLSILLARTGKTIVFVTHSLAEAVFLSDRVVVMTARPGRIKSTVVIPVPHPRSPDFMLEPRFGNLRSELYALLRDEIRQTVLAQRDSAAQPGAPP
jgi:ABC-type nitrate/sulfonate/bicarbonate transport system ATPase subunit